jgi:dihydropteroate synthase
MKDTGKTLNVKGKNFDISSPIVMGILNVTPDSFYDGGAYKNPEKIIERAGQIINEGGAIIDLGGYSSRPGAADISDIEEIQRVIPAIQSIIRHFPDAIISIDTFRSNVAKRAIEEGASIINDISAGELDPNMFQTVKKLGVPYVLMHMKGNPKTMSSFAVYGNLMKEVEEYFVGKINRLLDIGVSDLILDPGFGFAKTPKHSFELLKNLDYFKKLKIPILAGLSRKSMIYKTLSIDVSDSLNGTTALNMAALINGADILRVHDVKEAFETVKLYKSVYP